MPTLKKSAGLGVGGRTLRAARNPRNTPSRRKQNESGSQYHALEPVATDALGSTGDIGDIDACRIGWEGSEEGCTMAISGDASAGSRWRAGLGPPASPGASSLRRKGNSDAGGP